MPRLLSFIRWTGSRLALAVVGLAVIDRARSSWRRRSARNAHRRWIARAVLPSLYDRVPGASTAPRRRIGYRTVPLDRIVGTLRHPSQNTADFLPLPRLRGRNWEGRWQRIARAMDRLAVLPPVDLVKVGEDYYVEDGHNRVAAALQAGAVAIDADVTELLLPGHVPTPLLPDAGALLGIDEVRQAGMGRISRTVEQRSRTDELSRDDLARGTEPLVREEPASEAERAREAET
jgi:hypothetical protein